MRLFTTILLSLILVTSCDNSKNKKAALSAQEKQNLYYEVAESEIADQSEKIALLAALTKLPYDTIREALVHYYALTSHYGYSDSLGLISDKTITSISETYNIPKSKVASFIFSFKYEMQTQEEIEEKVIDNLESQAREEEEPYDPRY